MTNSAHVESPGYNPGINNEPARFGQALRDAARWEAWSPAAKLIAGAILALTVIDATEQIANRIFPEVAQ